MIPYRIIEAKRDGVALSEEEIAGFLDAYLADEIPDYQMAAFLMAVVFRGMNPDELSVLVERMLGSGAVLEWPELDRPCIDKHSTGGVGDKVSLALAPLAAELGLAVPMMSGRGLGHSGGTLDKLESIPGFRTALALDEFRSVLGRVGCAMIGQTDEIAPLDRRLYALRSVTATVPAIPLIAASIMSKKLAEGLDGLVLDVKTGAGSFLKDSARTRELAALMVGIGRAHGVPTVARLTRMDRPLGRAIGNGLEVVEAIECLKGGGPADLREVTLALAAEMVLLGGLDTDYSSAVKRATSALDGGFAFERFQRLVEAQGGDVEVCSAPDRLRTAQVTERLVALRGGWIAGIDATALGWGVVALGGGRRRLDDHIHPGVGFELAVGVADRVEAGGVLGLVHASDDEHAKVGASCLLAAIRISEDPVEDVEPLLGSRLNGTDP